VGGGGVRGVPGTARALRFAHSDGHAAPLPHPLRSSLSFQRAALAPLLLFAAAVAAAALRVATAVTRRLVLALLPALQALLQALLEALVATHWDTHWHVFPSYLRMEDPSPAVRAAAMGYVPFNPVRHAPTAGRGAARAAARAWPALRPNAIHDMHLISSPPGLAFEAAIDWALATLGESLAARGGSRAGIVYARLDVRAGPGAQEDTMALARKWLDWVQADAAIRAAGGMRPAQVPIIRASSYRMQVDQCIMLVCAEGRRRAGAEVEQ